jgi:hypothetical protein
MTCVLNICNSTDEYVCVCVCVCVCECIAPARGQGVCPVGPGVPGRHCGTAFPSPCPGVAPGACGAPLIPVCCGSVVCVCGSVCVCVVCVCEAETQTQHIKADIVANKWVFVRDVQV